MLNACAAQNMNVSTSGARNGLWVVRDPSQVLSYRDQGYLDVKRRLRPSHSAKVYAKQADEDYWDRHRTKWGDDRHIPIPMGRGIPFCGDVLGQGFFRLAAVGS